MSDNLNMNANEGSFGQKVYSFANESLRYAASAIFRATLRLNQEISINELLDALEDVDLHSQPVADEPLKTQVLDIPSLPETEVESMATTCSSLDSTIPKADSQDSLTSTEHEGEEDNEIDAETKLRIISLDEVSDHYTLNDSWMVIYDKVYNFTNFMHQHPGGWEIMHEYSGYDATVAFRGVGHSRGALNMMEPYLIGILPKCERLYTNKCQW